MRLYLDASTIIYSIEAASPFRDTVIDRIARLTASAGASVFTSRLSRLECRVKPLRDSDARLIGLYDDFFTRGPVRVIEIGVTVVERATDLRVRYRFKTPDAIHLATAIEERADVFLTGDRNLHRCTELNVEVL